MKHIPKLLTTGLLLAALTLGANAAETLYPIRTDEYHNYGKPRIEYTYRLDAQTDPDTIPITDFEQENIAYTLLTMTANPEVEIDRRTHSETVMLTSDTRNAEENLSLFEETMEVTTADGYSGVLTLDTESITTEASAYGSYEHSHEVQRTYPGLSAADTSFVPKTVEAEGHTLALSDVQWPELGGFYTANATYSGTFPTSYVSEYTVTATYNGEVEKTIPDEVVYTVTFTGTPLEVPEAVSIEEIDTSAGLVTLHNWMLIMCGLIVLMMGVAFGFLLSPHHVLKERKRY